MSRVLLVHGINNTYASRPQMAERWIPALRGGLDNASLDGDVPAVALEDKDIDCVYYGDVFRPQGEYLSGDSAHLTASDVDDGLELDLLMAWWEAAASIDGGVTAPGAETLGRSANARAALLALSGAQFFVGTSEWVMVKWLKQVAAYFNDPYVRERVQRRLAATITPDSRVLVAHSLGSVVAYEGLCANPDWPITDLVTLGSPLGIPRPVMERLIPSDRTWPHVDRWVNITDANDFVALQPRLCEVFGPRVTDVGISNGILAHKIEHYLSAKPTGLAIAHGLLEYRA